MTITKHSVQSEKFDVQVKWPMLMRQPDFIPNNQTIKQQQAHKSPTPQPTLILTMLGLPVDLLRYHLLSFLPCDIAVELAKTSQSLFHVLRHKIYITQLVSCERFIRQSRAQSKHIGICCAVMVPSPCDLESLLQHIASGKLSSPLLHLEIDFTRPRHNIVLPESLHTLSFGYYAYDAIPDLKLPVNLHTLRFGHWFNETSLGGLILPATLQTLSFGYHFNKSLDGISLPSSLHTLEFGASFNRSLRDASLPQSLHTLSFADHYNLSLGSLILPASLQTLTFGTHFNKSLRKLHCPPNLVIRKRGQMLAAHLLPKGLQLQQA